MKELLIQPQGAHHHTILIAKIGPLDYNLIMPWNILGHEWAKSILQEHIIQNRLRHAYLFTGPQGVGRRTLGLNFAQAINCPQPPVPGESCGNCRTCQHIAKMQHPDLSIIQADKVGGVIKVEQIRELQHNLSLAPYEASYRLALLLRFEEAHTSAANALLKTLEEPPSRVILILTAESQECLPATIVSRCEVLNLRSLPLEEVIQGLQELLKIDEDQARLLAHISNRRPGYAINLSRQAHLMEQRQSWLEDHAAILSATRLERFAYAATLTKDRDRDQVRENLQMHIQVWLSYWRDVLMCKIGPTVPFINLDHAEEIELLASQLELEQIHCTIRALERTQQLVSLNINLQLAVENLMLEIPHR
jgi:DNA polymerase-3 subunit delta'